MGVGGGNSLKKMRGPRRRGSRPGVARGLKRVYASAAVRFTANPMSAKLATVMAERGFGVPAASIHPVMSSES